jgi:adenylyltransferase/sulfurtransferase
MDAREHFALIDVREAHEAEIARIDGARLIPLGEITDRTSELSEGEEIIVHCHSGVRSARAVELLQERGFKNVFTLEGGIDAWSEEIDPNVPKY